MIIPQGTPTSALDTLLLSLVLLLGPQVQRQLQQMATCVFSQQMGDTELREVKHPWPLLQGILSSAGRGAWIFHYDELTFNGISLTGSHPDSKYGDRVSAYSLHLLRRSSLQTWTHYLSRCGSGTCR
jgi:hypothetical protein